MSIVQARFLAATDSGRERATAVEQTVWGSARNRRTARAACALGASGDCARRLAEAALADVPGTFRPCRTRRRRPVIHPTISLTNSQLCRLGVFVILPPHFPPPSLNFFNVSFNCGQKRRRYNVARRPPMVTM